MLKMGRFRRNQGGGLRTWRLSPNKAGRTEPRGEHCRGRQAVRARGVPARVRGSFTADLTRPRRAARGVYLFCALEDEKIL